jgi:hypothetical protein
MEFLKLLKKLLITDYIRGSGKKNSGDQAQKTPEKLRGFRGSGKKNFLKLQKLRKNFGDQAPEKLRKNSGKTPEKLRKNSGKTSEKLRGSGSSLPLYHTSLNLVVNPKHSPTF